MRVRRVGNEIRGAAGVPIAPDMVEVEPVADLVRCGAAEVERRYHRTSCPEGRVGDHDTVRLRRSSRELRIAQVPAGEVADPEVQIAGARPGRMTAAALH